LQGLVFCLPPVFTEGRAEELFIISLTLVLIFTVCSPSRGNWTLPGNGSKAGYPGNTAR
jgi:hypothetical protein